MSRTLTRQTEAPSRPPVARAIPRVTTVHDTELVDPYAWLRQRDDPRVVAHLEAENAFTEREMAATEDLQEELFQEMVGRIQETDQTVPVRIDDHFYYSRTVKGLQYRIYCRRQGGLDGAEEVLLDLNRLAEERPAGDGGGFLKLGALEVSPDHRCLAYSLDETGGERYTLHVLDLERREHLAEAIPNTSPNLVWSEDGRSFFYATLDASRRPDRAYRHRLGQDAAGDELIYREDDERFFLSLEKTRSRRFLVLRSESRITSELRVLDGESPQAGWQLIVPRRQGIEVSLAHHSDHFYFLTNEEARNFRLMRAPVATPGRRHWRELVAHREDETLVSVDLFRSHLVLSLRSRGLRQLRIRALATGAWHDVTFDEPVYTVAAVDNPEFDASTLRFNYSSLVTPPSVYDYDMDTRERELRKRAAVLGGYDAGRFTCERIEATAGDGTRVPISLVYRKDLVRDGSNPTLLRGYGAYGTSVEPGFSALRLSLLERGFVAALAHVRGGGELGRAWYEGGKLEHKRNTFGDFIAAAEHLIDAGYTSPRQLAIRGGSAGGLLIGAVLNQRPDLFQAALAEVPFVDVVNTMLDPSIPLTVIEYEEWGDPRQREVFEYIRSYSPYDNVEARDYPHLLVTAGLHDPRVQYWEPAKWVAKLRAKKTDGNRLLLKVDLDSGHGGASGRYQAMREEAFKQAFLLSVLRR